MFSLLRMMKPVRKTVRPSASSRKPMLEPLEDRIALAIIYSYNPGLGTIPDAQGWTREENPSIKGPEPVISGDVLHAFPQPVGGIQYWHKQSESLDFAKGSYVLEADLHVISSNYVTNGRAQRSGYYLQTIDSVGHSFFIGIDSSGIVINTDGNFIPGRGVPRTPFDSTDVFHTYRFVIEDGQGTLFIDKNQFASTPLGGTSGLDAQDPQIRNWVFFGDGSGVGTSESELRQFSFSTPVSGVPEPSGLVLLTLGSLSLLGYARRRRKSIAKAKRAKFSCIQVTH